MFLEQIGADAHVRALFQPHAAQRLELGRVSFAAREQYRIYLEDGDCEAVPAGRLRHEDVLPAVGDWVAARQVDPKLALIEAVLPRRTRFSRRAAGGTVAEQVIAANLDLAVIVCGLDGDFNVRRLERYLVLARESGVDALIVLNKRDLCDDVLDRLTQVAAVAQRVPRLVLSARESVQDLRSLIRGRTVAFLGSSGVGKSTIVNALIGEQRQSTLPVREADSRGRHTTTNRMLIPLAEGGAVIDTPGMRELQLWATEDSLDEVFDDVAALALRCRFRDCSHTNEPECAVQSALQRGEIDSSRWRSYRKLQAELRRELLQQDTLARTAAKSKWKAIHKAMRNHPKYRR
jgi:ribosome biogenesis GTPase / thiamine phosphate phosphatase